jgi:hypothetical protein
VAFLEQFRHQVDHLGDVLRGARVVRRAADVELGGVFHERIDVSGRDLFGRLVLEARRDEHLVLASIEGVVCEVTDIRDVHDLLGAIAEVLEGTAKKVGQHEGAQVADVHEAVDGRSAGIQPHHAFLRRLQHDFDAAVSVVKPDRGQAHIESILTTY